MAIEKCSIAKSNAKARARLLSRTGEPLFFADWERVLFIHFEVEAAALQKDVPFELDRYDEKALVSLVAFTMRGLRPARRGAFAAWLFRPVSTNDFLNVRAYVRHEGEPGIYFLREWVSNRLSVSLGPAIFGLPYRFGQFIYQHRPEQQSVSGKVTALDGALRYSSSVISPAPYKMCEPHSLDEFLHERYTAFTRHGSAHRFFRIWHSPWKLIPVTLRLEDQGLLETAWPWFRQAKLIGANYSPGAGHVWMGWPHFISNHPPGKNKPRHRTLSAFYEMP
jgi:uncharacterized protein YqjF (DUF2071 family)